MTTLNAALNILPHKTHRPSSRRAGIVFWKTNIRSIVAKQMIDVFECEIRGFGVEEGDNRTMDAAYILRFLRSKF